MALDEDRARAAAQNHWRRVTTMAWKRGEKRPEGASVAVSDSGLRADEGDTGTSDDRLCTTCRGDRGGPQAAKMQETLDPVAEGRIDRAVALLRCNCIEDVAKERSKSVANPNYLSH